MSLYHTEGLGIQKHLVDFVDRALQTRRQPGELLMGSIRVRNTVLFGTEKMFFVEDIINCLSYAGFIAVAALFKRFNLFIRLFRES